MLTVILDYFLAIFNKDVFVLYYNYFIIIILTAIIIYLILFDFRLNNYNYKLDHKKKEDALNGLYKQFKLEIDNLKDEEDVHSFVKDYFYKKKKGLFNVLKIIEKSDSIFILLGSVGTFLILLFFILSLDFKGFGISNNLTYKTSILLNDFKTSFYPLITGIVCSIIINLINKISKMRKRINDLIDKISKLLAKEVKFADTIDKQDIEVLSKLLLVVEDGFAKLTDTIEEGFSDLNQLIRKEKEKQNDLKEDSTSNKVIDIKKNDLESSMNKLTVINSEESSIDSQMDQENKL